MKTNKKETVSTRGTKKQPLIIPEESDHHNVVPYSIYDNNTSYAIREAHNFPGR